MFNINERVQRLEGNILKRGMIIKINLNYVCCKGTDNEHVHDVCYDVIWDGSKEISKGFLPHGLEKEKGI